ncbi:hypothetical protein M0812_13866 [Anaeramoeba flamelloides]|uniref:Uncharacterized protein n=1 Tax=Anaeramoeba flamelloides TaxID=1746091 RepID=A0AAV7ZIL5_9EUKA|nr:hypothetical protein M0812_13866 [Anaeramoeba flamelloides]
MSLSTLKKTATIVGGATLISTGLSVLHRKDIIDLETKGIPNETIRYFWEKYLDVGDFIVDQTCELLGIPIEKPPRKAGVFEKTFKKAEKKVKKISKEIQNDLKQN